MEEDKLIWVIGIGPGSKDLIFPAALDKMKEMDIILGSQRQLETVPKSVQSRGQIPPWKMQELYPFVRGLVEEGKKVGILASGDPLFFGIGVSLQAYFPNQIGIIPSISSLTYFFSYLGLSMNDVYLTSCHGRDIEFEKLLSFNKIGLLTDCKIGPYQIAQNLLRLGANYMMYIGENLSYPSQKVSVATLEDIEDQNYEMNVVILIRKEGHER